ncbi:MAG TPA: peptidase M55 [Chloroflexi bacterium]|nr:peptidase M55 [Chloroflexota bacterium]
MKVYIATDMEGTVGVVNRQHTHSGKPEHPAARRWLTNEVNAAIAGAKKAGADEFVVLDSHGNCLNILADQLDEDALLIAGYPGMTTIGAITGVDDTFDAAGFIGFHAREGTEIAVLDHTAYSETVARVVINDHEVGEYGVVGAYIGMYGVPVVFAAGDQAFEAQIKDLIPNIAYARTKTAVSRYSAINVHPNRAAAMVRDAAEDGVSRRDEIEPITFKAPITMKVTFHQPVMSQLAEWVPGVKRVDSRTLSFTADDYKVVHGAFSSMCALSGEVRRILA